MLCRCCLTLIFAKSLLRATNENKPARNRNTEQYNPSKLRLVVVQLGWPLLSLLLWDLYNNNNHVANMFVSNFTHYLSRLKTIFLMAVLVEVRKKNRHDKRRQTAKANKSEYICAHANAQAYKKNRWNSRTTNWTHTDIVSMNTK